MSELIQHIGLWLGVLGLSLRELHKSGFIFGKNGNGESKTKNAAEAELRFLRVEKAIKDSGQEVAKKIEEKVDLGNRQIVEELKEGNKKTEEMKNAIIELVAFQKARKR